MWLVYYKPTSLIMAEGYQKYYPMRQDALDAIDRLQLDHADCEVCPVMWEEDFCDHSCGYEPPDDGEGRGHCYKCGKEEAA